ncbi:glycosyltransferase family 2 protein [Cohnella nanjingensis]|uniref:Glycosyltransferase family 2 protein n=1 Tax=Cohnella nanjingensis TaxID=1387779 RepID=A0A7X0RV71_9BACL|nr:glycosyltransferase family 2 protein [Cohnella nanjingensis]MBB6674283.1 glycosyltransferase family 2 protein [Cohnella nanjingensis]
MNAETKYSIVVPVYNEEAVIHDTYRELKAVMDGIGERYELVFVNDGSRDRTADILKGYAERDRDVKLIDFSRNFGHQIAITAGMDYASGEAVVVIDADLQDPPSLIPRMIAKWREGYDVVYAKRTARKGETAFKRWTAHAFYRLLQATADVDIPVDTGDFRLLDRRVCEELRRLPEKNRYVRGLVSWVGFRQTSVEYVRDERLAGETQYPLRKMLKLSLDGMTSFSSKPLKLSTTAGLLLMGAGILYALIELGAISFGGASFSGWQTVIVLQLLFTGFLLAAIGMAGEYIGRIYDEAKGRPLYIVRECYGLPERAANAAKRVG